MNLQPLVRSRCCTVSLPHTRSFNLSTKVPPSSNLTFGSSLHQRPLSASPAKRGVLQLVAAYSRGRESAPESPAKALRRILDLPGVHQAPACFDALSAKLVERAGFQCCLTSGM